MKNNKFNWSIPSTGHQDFSAKTRKSWIAGTHRNFILFTIPGLITVTKLNNWSDSNRWMTERLCCILNIDKPKGWFLWCHPFFKTFIQWKKSRPSRHPSIPASGVLPFFWEKGHGWFLISMKPTNLPGHIHLGIRTDTSTQKVRFGRNKMPGFFQKRARISAGFFQRPSSAKCSCLFSSQDWGEKGLSPRQAREGFKMPKREVEFLELELRKSNSVSPTPNSLQQRDLHPIIGGRSWSKLKVGAHLSGLMRIAMRKAFSPGRHMQPGSSWKTRSRIDTWSTRLIF